LLLFLFVVTAAYLLLTRQRDTPSTPAPTARTEASNA
jgi:hypothetical protein